MTGLHARWTSLLPVISLHPLGQLHEQPLPPTQCIGDTLAWAQVVLNILARQGRVTVTLPASSWHAPPGNYMLFLISGGGVPSKAVYIGLGGAKPRQSGALPSLRALMPGHRHHLSYVQAQGPKLMLPS